MESRTLLTTIPAATATAGPLNLSSLVANAGGNNASESSTQVAVDPNDPSKLVATWVDYDTTMLADTDGYIQSVVESAYSINGGQSWLPMLVEPTTGLSLATPGVLVSPGLYDPATSGPTHQFLNETAPSLGFDDSGNFYILSEFTGSGDGSGAITLQKYNFNGSFPTAVTLNSNVQTPNPYGFEFNDLKVIYEWDGADDQALEPTMTVDDNQFDQPDQRDDADGCLHGQHLRRVGRPGRQQGGPDPGFQPQPDQGGSLVGRREQLQPPDDRQPQQWVAGPRWQRPDEPARRLAGADGQPGPTRQRERAGQ